MIIVGIMGGIGHGKTTFAESLKQAEPRSKYIETSDLISQIINDWQSKTSFIPNPAKPDDVRRWLGILPSALENVTPQKIDSDLFAFNKNDATRQTALYEKLYVYLNQVQKKPSLLSTPVTVKNKADYRALLQWLGGYVQVKLPPGFWFRELLRRLEQFESKGIKLGILGGVRFPADVKVIKDGGGYIILIVRPTPRELDANDPTEQARKLITPDTSVHNDAGIDDLVACAHRVYADLKSDSLHAEYFAGKTSA